MNVLQLVPELNVGGVETGVVDITAGLIKCGHKVVVVSNGGRLVKELTGLGAIHYELPVHKKDFIVALKTIPKLAQIIYNEDVDIVHARSRVPAIIGFFAVRLVHSKYKKAAFNAEIKPVFLTTCHGYYSKHIFSRVMGWGKFVIANSQIIAKHMAEDFNVPRQRIKIIPRGVDLSKFEFKPRQPKTGKSAEFTIAVISRLSAIKGHTYFIRAVSRVMRRISNVKVLIIGDAGKKNAKYKEELIILAKKLGIGKRINFLGVREDIPQLLSKIDLLVLPSIAQEAFGRVLIEAAAAGVPLIATRVGGITDFVVHRSNGLLVEPEDEQALSDAITELIVNRELALSLAARARKDVEARFTVDKMVDSTVDVYKKAMQPNVLIIKLSAVGDVVLAVPSMRAVRKAFPKGHISLLVGIKSSEIMRNCPYVDDLIISRKLKNIFDVFKLSNLLRKECFDMVIDFQNSAKSHILSWLAGIPKRIGYDNGKFSFLYNYRVKGAKLAIGPVEHQFRLLSSIGINAHSHELELWPQQEDFDYINDFLDSRWVSREQVLVGMAPCASTRWKTKRWPAKNYAELIDLLAKEGIRTVITGEAADMPFAKDVFSLTKAKPTNAIGKTSITELAAMIKRCSVYVSSDTASMHVAASMHTPIVALFGPTDPIRHLPANKDCIVIKKGLKCSPCYKPNCSNIACMNGITVNEVFKAVKKYIKS